VAKQVLIFPFTVPLDGAGNMRDPGQGIFARSLARTLADRLDALDGLSARCATLTSHGAPAGALPAPDEGEHGWVVASQPWSLDEALALKLPDGTEYLLHGVSELTDRVRLRLLLVDQPHRALALDHVVLRPRAELFAALDEAASSVAQALGLKARTDGWPTGDVEAFVAWLRGRDMSAAHEAGVHVADPQRSFDGYLEALRRDPHFRDAQEQLLGLALDFALGGQGPLQAAREACERLLAQDPSAFRASAVLAELDLTEGEPAKASARLSALLAEHAQFWPAYERLGQALIRQERYDEALPWLDRALGKREDDVDALLGRGLCLAELGRLDEAIAAWRQAQEKGHDSIGLHENLALALDRRGRRAEARVERRRARELSGELTPLDQVRRFFRRVFGLGSPQARPARAPAEGSLAAERRLEQSTGPRPERTAPDGAPPRTRG
jgi:tetratricopeptide (TPR) repeat protein